MLSFKASCTIYAIRCLIFQTLFSFLFIFSPFSPCLLVSRQQQDCRKHTRSVLFPLSMPQQQCVALPMTSFWPRSQCLSHFTSREEHQARHPEMVLAGGEQHRQGASASGGMKLNICIYFLPLVVTAIMGGDPAGHMQGSGYIPGAVQNSASRLQSTFFVCTASALSTTRSAFT